MKTARQTARDALSIRVEIHMKVVLRITDSTEKVLTPNWVKVTKETT